ncbi:MAG: hypothetical protein RIG88_14600, partial [Roseitalea porphyridii]|uniref:hypothetical protein n=1 Tax=Roseitalea porphyridii TaxID=1852022 RepID=UPI0032ECE525
CISSPPFTARSKTTRGSSLSACFNRKRRLYGRSNIKQNRNAALAEWRQLLAAQGRVRPSNGDWLALV